MPEGHTIHRIARDHGKLLSGRTIRVSSPQGRFAGDAARIDGATLERIHPYGKHLFYDWSTGEIGHVHLGLFGKYRVQQTDESPDPIGEVRMRLQTEPDEMIEKVIRSSRGIGDLLMDQSVICRVGNVYRAEGLFVSGMHPLRPGFECRPAELEALWTTVQSMLRRGVRDGRIVTVTRAELGLAPNARIPRSEATYAYKRDRCLGCGDEIRRIEIANRTCYYCPTHQSS